MSILWSILMCGTKYNLQNLKNRYVRTTNEDAMLVNKDCFSYTPLST
jgi:hypothetical protein